MGWRAGREWERRRRRCRRRLNAPARSHTRAHTHSRGTRAVERCDRPAGEWVNGMICGRARPPRWPGGRSYELYNEPSGGPASERPAAANSFYTRWEVIILILKKIIQ